MDDFKKENQFDEYKSIPYFELMDIAEKEQDIEKRKTLFEFSNSILEYEFMKLVRQKEQHSFS